MAEEDPFACFNNDDDDDEEDDKVENDMPRRKRKNDCGVLAFHSGTEHCLLVHVQNELRRDMNRPKSPAVVLDAIDTFCMERHWMMHVGPQKGQVLETFLMDCLTARTKVDNTITSQCRRQRHRFILLELGTYCGYSSIRLANLLTNHGIPFLLYTIEANPQHAAVATALIELAGLQDHISVLVLDIVRHQTVVDLIQDKLVREMDWIDFLFLDHDKDAYLTDLILLEQSGWIRAGTYTAADNVVFARIDSYRKYIQGLVDSGIVETKLVEGSIEYSGPEEENAMDKEVFRDGIGKSMICMSMI